MGKKIDLQALRQQVQELQIDKELKHKLLEAISEKKRYGLVWEESEEEAQEIMREYLPVFKEDESKRLASAPDGSPNHVLIEGDNLNALTALTYTHAGKIDVIYIDPPYNTGNKDFVYNDSFVDKEDGYRHSKWLSFMNRRLRIAKKLLSESGVIFISIDDNEASQLKLLCDEIFDFDSFIGDVSWQRTYSIRNDSKGIPSEVEHILVYAKSSLWQPKKLPRTAEMNSAYSNPDGDVCDWMSGSPVASDAATHQGMVYAIQHPFTGKLFYPSSRAHWRYEQSQMLAYLNGWCKYKLEDLNDDIERANVCGVDVEKIKPHVKAIVLAEDLETSKYKAKEVYDKGPWPRFFFTNKGKGGMRRKVYLDNVGGRIATNYWPYDETGHTDEAKKELIKIFGQPPFDTPKPTRLIRRILDLSTNKESTILDFFAGSGTTLHATMQLNSEDGGHRQCILVTNNENGICEKVTYERNKRVIQGYTTPKGEQVPGLANNNLRYYKTEFVPRENGVRNRRALTASCIGLLCIKNNIYHEEATFGGRKFKKNVLRYFKDSAGQMLVVLDERVVSLIVPMIAEVANKENPLKVYVYSDGAYAYDDEFKEVLPFIELSALPDAFVQALETEDVLPKQKVREEEIAEFNEEEKQEALNDTYNYVEKEGEGDND